MTLLNVIKSTSIDRTPFDQGDLDTYQGMPVGFTQAGYPYLGDPHAPVTLEKYSHFLFPFCARHFEQTVPTLVKQYVQTGQAKYVFRDMPLVGLLSTAPVGYVAVRFIQHNSGETYTLVSAYPVDTFGQWLDALATAAYHTAWLAGCSRSAEYRDFSESGICTRTQTEYAIRSVFIVSVLYSLV